MRISLFSFLGERWTLLCGALKRPVKWFKLGAGWFSDQPKPVVTAVSAGEMGRKARPACSRPVRPSDASPERTASRVPSMQDIREAVNRRWELRFNVLLNNLEVRPAGTASAPFVPLSERLHNSIVMSVQEDHPACYRSWVDCYLFSEAVPAYHPLRAYLTSLPAWDGEDYVGALAARVSSDALWVKVFRRWLRGAVKGWLGEDGAGGRVFDCQTALLLVSERQGLGKSTFCRSLLPAGLRAFYSDKFDLTADSHAERQMGQFALINMDEFDRYTERQMGVLKNLMQLTDVKMRRPRNRGLSEVRRVAAFIGTSNFAELLTDPTGSRRFFCQMVEAPIDGSPIDHDALYAQVMAELAAGEATYFSKDEEAEIEEHNLSYYRYSPLTDAFHRSFGLPSAGEDAEWLSASEIFETLKHESPRALQGVSIAKLGRELRLIGVVKKRGKRGYTYAVCHRRDEE